jgi:UTP:GlnB (protein PII) uridylyltransferase
MAALTALLQAQITTLQKANKAMHVRRKRTRKALVSDTALSVSEGQAMGGYEEVEAEIREEMLRSKKRTSRCSKCGQEGHTYRTCRV